MTTPTKDGFTVFEQDGNKCAILHHGELSTEIFHDFVTGCRNYVTNKEITENKQTIKVMTALKGYIWEDWVSVHYDELRTLPLTEFLQHFKDAFMPTEWETDVHVKLNALTQSDTQTFCDYSTAVQNINSLLCGTESFLDNPKLRTCIKAGMDLTLVRRTRAHDKKLHLIVEFQPWLDALKELDTDLQAERAERHSELEAMTKAMWNKSHDDHGLSNPSCKYNAAPSKSIPSANAPSRLNSKDYPPKLTPEEGSLLINNHGCTKCRRVYVFHTKFECPNDFPKGTSYKPITQAGVDAARHAHENKTKKTIGAVTPATLTMGPSSHPVAAIMGYALNPVGYQANYSSAVLSDKEDEDELDSSEVHGRLAAIVEDVNNVAPDSLNLLKADSEFVAPLMVPHMFWHASASAPNSLPIQFDCLLDIGLHLVIIREQLVKDLNLHHRKLHEPIVSELAMQPDGPKFLKFTHFVKLKLYDSSGTYIAKTIHAVISPTLCAPVPLGLPFLKHNNIVIDANCCTAIDKKNNFNLLHPSSPPKKKDVKATLWFNYEAHKTILNLRSALLTEMKEKFTTKQKVDYYRTQKLMKGDIIGAVHERLEELTTQDQLKRMGREIFNKYKRVFEPIPHVDELPTNIYCWIQLKDTSKTIATWLYSSPCKYREAWWTLLKHHKDAGRIRPSNSSSASPSFLVPKTDSTVLPRWVNDYRVLNSNTVLDSYPLPCVDDILADCAKGRIWSHLDMTNSFFHTQVHPDYIHLTAVTTPFGLYKWTAMPQGLKNALPIHQCWMNAALCPLIGKICHIYIDDIVIWSNTVTEHVKHINMVMNALIAARLFCNPKKCDFFLTEMDFLRHHISARGIEPNTSKIQKILDWPIPTNSTEVRWWAWYRGMTQYPSIFAFLVFWLRRWLTKMHGTDTMLHASSVSPHDRVHTQCSIFVKSLLLAAPLFGNV